MARLGVWGRMFTLVVALLALVAGALGQPGGAAAANLSPATVYFPTTGHNVDGRFMSAWQANGGLMTYGYPLSEPLTESGLTVQYFERARLEWHPESAGTKWQVQATLLGNWLTEGRRGEAPFQRLVAKTDAHCTYYAETGHRLCFGFKSYWQQHGGLYVFGYPISEEFTENGHTVQYFERARFEWHPEYRGTPYEVLLGRLGAQLASARHIDTARKPIAPGAITVFPGLLDERWSRAIHTGDGAVLGAITADSLNVRSAPSLSAPIVGTTYRRHIARVYDLVAGDTVDGVNAWYRVGSGQYVAAAWVQPFVPTPPPAVYSGHWVDVSLSTFYAVAYDGGTPVYAAIITAGRDNQTPTGVYHVFARVENETMDAATVGIPKGSPDYYYLTNVLYTQYFKAGGYALHGNYWTPPSQFGGFGTHGCVGLMNPDAAWFWGFLGYGSTVSIHY